MRGAVARLAHPRVQADVADEAARVAEARNLASVREECRSGDHPDARDRHQPAGIRRVQHELCEVALDRDDLLGQEVDLAQRGADGVALVIGQRLRGEPLATGDAEGVGHRRPCLEVAVQHGEDLVLGSGAVRDELGAPSDAPAQRSSRFVGLP